MKLEIIVSSIIVLAFASCGNSQTQEKSKPATPKALADNSSSYEIVSKRGSGDLVEGLYNELVDNTPELKELEGKIDRLNTSKSDSTELFDKYNSHNRSYYSSADTHVGQIKDSVLKDKIKLLISSSLTKYNSKISAHSDLLKSIEAETATLSDLHELLKITRTLPIIEKYQNTSLPSTKSLQDYLKHLNETVKYADTLTKK
jgi:hypothetical protein